MIFPAFLHSATITARPAPTPDFRSDINALRALAVVLVVLFHFKLPGLRGGFVGVDVFFVISGFLMTQIILGGLETGRFALGGFYLARARRILPALVALSGVLMILGAGTLFPDEYDTLAKHVQASLFFYSNHAYVGASTYFDPGIDRKWLLHTWSLSVEFQFYVLYPLVVLAAFKAGLRRRGIACLLAAASLPLVINTGINTAKAPSVYFYLLHARAWELLAGGLAFIVAERFPLPPRWRQLAAWCGVALIALAAIAFKETMVWPGWGAALPVAGASLALLANHATSRTTGNGVVQWVGRRSYSIYLWHWPVVVFLYHAHLFDGAAARLAGIAFALLAAEASYRWIEQPGRRLFRMIRAREIAGAALVVGSLVAGIVFIQRDDGGYWRFGKDAARIQELEEARTDWGFHNDGRQPPFTAVFGTDGVKPPDVVILGDSHAGHLLPRIEAQPARPLSVAFLNRDGCLPVRGYERADDPSMRCAPFTSNAWAHLLAHPPKRLVITSVWLTYFYPREPRRNPPPWVCRKNAGPCHPVQSDAELDEAFRVLEADVRALAQRGTEIVILGPLPFCNRGYADDERIRVASQHILLLDTIGEPAHPPRREVPLTEVDANAMRVMLRLQRVARAGATLIRPERKLCHDGRCPVASRAGTPYYLDFSHLRPGYVRSAAFDWLDAEVYGRPTPVRVETEAL